MVSNYDHTEKLHSGLYVSVSKLDLSTSADRFHSGRMKVTCQAVVGVGHAKSLPPPQEYKRDAVVWGEYPMITIRPFRGIFGRILRNGFSILFLGWRWF